MFELLNWQPQSSTGDSAMLGPVGDRPLRLQVRPSVDAASPVVSVAEETAFVARLVPIDFIQHCNINRGVPPVRVSLKFPESLERFASAEGPCIHGLESDTWFLFHSTGLRRRACLIVESCLQRAHSPVVSERVDYTLDLPSASHDVVVDFDDHVPELRAEQRIQVMVRAGALPDVDWDE
jgi:hypothetical protein